MAEPVGIDVPDESQRGDDYQHGACYEEVRMMAEPEWPRYLKRCRVCGGDWTPLNQQTGRYDYCEQCVPGGYQLAWSAPGWEPTAMDALLIEDRDRLKREMEAGFYGQRQCGIVDCHACHEHAATLADLALTAVRRSAVGEGEG